MSETGRPRTALKNQNSRSAEESQHLCGQTTAFYLKNMPVDAGSSHQVVQLQSPLRKTERFLYPMRRSCSLNLQAHSQAQPPWPLSLPAPLSRLGVPRVPPSPSSAPNPPDSSAFDPTLRNNVERFPGPDPKGRNHCGNQGNQKVSFSPQQEPLMAVLHSFSSFIIFYYTIFKESYSISFRAGCHLQAFPLVGTDAGEREQQEASLTLL